MTSFFAEDNEAMIKAYMTRGKLIKQYKEHTIFAQKYKQVGDVAKLASEKHQRLKIVAELHDIDSKWNTRNITAKEKVAAAFVTFTESIGRIKAIDLLRKRNRNQQRYLGKYKLRYEQAPVPSQIIWVIMFCTHVNHK